jgi:hypothetical protein
MYLSLYPAHSKKSSIPTTFYAPATMTTPDGNYDASPGDFTWSNAKVLWTLLIIGASVILLRILYKICLKVRERRGHGNDEHELAGFIHGSTRQGLEGGGIRLQRPSRALTTRRSSEVSALPRYERFDEGEPCSEDAELEKRGRYSYVLGERWPGKR